MHLGWMRQHVTLAYPIRALVSLPGCPLNPPPPPPLLTPQERQTQLSRQLSEVRAQLQAAQRGAAGAAAAAEAAAAAGAAREALTIKLAASEKAKRELQVGLLRVARPKTAVFEKG